MANTVLAGARTGATLYYQVWDENGEVYNGSAFEAYSAGNWATYARTLTEKGVSGVYAATPPSLSAAVYQLFVFDQEGASPAVGDPIVGGPVLDLRAVWPTAAQVRAEMDSNSTQLAAIVADTNEVQGDLVNGGRLDLLIDAIKVATDALATALELDGAVYRLTANALEQAPAAPTVAAIRAEMDSNSTQLAAIVADTNEVQGDLVNGGRLDLLIDAIKVATDALATALELDGAVYRLTANALEQAPAFGDATEAKQDTIIAALGALNDVDAAGVASAVMASVVDGAVTVEAALKRILALAAGGWEVTDTDPLTIALKDQAGATLYSFVFSVNNTVRTVV